MRVAIIGGGASGLITAWLLDRVHAVTLFEGEDVLGGHVRTLGRNVPGAPATEGVFLDAGVVEFERDNFPTLHRLFERLGLELRDIAGPSALHRLSGPPVYSPGCGDELSPRQRLINRIRLIGPGLARRRFLRTAVPHEAALSDRALGDFLDDDVFGLWMKLLATYAWSTPTAQVPELSAAMCLPVLRDFCTPNRWTAVAGGSYAYLERLLEDISGVVHTGARVRAVHRGAEGVTLRLVSGDVLPFDAVVIATQPDQILPLLGDPSEGERRRFGAWEGSDIQTLVHTDFSLYERRRLALATEFDVFELPGGGGGYNALLNRLAGLPPRGVTRYGLAFQLDHEIDPARILHRQEHHVASLTVGAMRYRAELKATNGERQTWIAGAWLGDGLQEGAVCSALAVSRALGGRTV